MFISANQFERDMGVHQTIGRFFVDRKVPADNSFWKNRLLYIGYGNGYISIPVYYDILFRLGLPLHDLLNEKHVQFMEGLMHYAILHEKQEITWKEELTAIRSLLEGRVKHPGHFDLLNRYLEQPVLLPLGFFGTEFPSLNRADAFLYILCDLPLTEQQWEKAIRYWYALHPSYLIMDDIRDYGKDLEKGEENVVIEMGGGPEGFEKTMELLRKNGRIMDEINPALAVFLTNDEETMRKFVPLTD